MPDAKFQFSLDINADVALFHVIVFSIDSEPIPSPAPSKRAFVPAVVAMPILKSPSCILSTSTINSVPSTYKSPLILTDPEVWPTPNGWGSIQISDGPSIYAVFPAPFAIDIPIPVVINLLVTFNDVAVTAPLTLIPPVPVINLLLRSKLPPSCGVVSSTTFLRNVLSSWVSEIEPVRLLVG